MLKSTNKFPVKVSADSIRLYYYIEFDNKVKSNSGIIVDDACYELMFVKENNVKILDGNNKAFVLPPFYTLNNMQGPFRFKFPKTFSSFCVKLQPWMNASYVPIEESQVLDLNKYYSKDTNKLHNDIFNSKSIEEMVEYVEPYIISLNVIPNKEVDLVKDICNHIYEKSGNVSVNELAEKFSIYRQKLNALFKKEVKYTLKNFINNIRIRSCLAYKLKYPEMSLTEIAYQFEFYDQAHFIHSFKKACGVSPSEYVNNPGYSTMPWEKNQN